MTARQIEKEARRQAYENGTWARQFRIGQQVHLARGDGRRSPGIVTGHGPKNVRVGFCNLFNEFIIKEMIHPKKLKLGFGGPVPKAMEKALNKARKQLLVH